MAYCCCINKPLLESTYFCSECGLLRPVYEHRVIDSMDSVEDGPIDRNRRKSVRISDLERSANKIYDEYKKE